MKKLQILLAAMSLFGLPVSTAMAQQSTGSISGTITDPGGAAIPGTKVTAKHEPTGQEFATVSSSAGLYVFASLPVGPYTVTVEQPGFKRVNRGNVEIRVAQRQVLDLQLEVGDVQQVVDVTAEAPLLEATTSERGQNFSPKFMNTLPLFTGGIRNPESFVTYMPGVNSYREVSINGSGGRAKEVMIDGGSLTIPESGGVVFNFPAAEMFGEFKLLTGTYSAEYGRFGGGVELFISKSGTNQLHGAGFWNLRRDIFNAAGYNVNRNPLNRPGFRPKERFNEAGFGVGGPVWLPKAYDGRNKTFFFFTYSRDLRPATAAPTISTVPTTLMKQGNFSEVPRLVYDPATTAGGVRQPFPGNAIPTSRFSRVAQGFVGSIPDPNVAGLNSNYSFVNLQVLNDYIWSFKVDHAFSPNNRIAYFHSLQDQNREDTTALPGPLGNGLGENFQRPQYFRVNHDLVPTPTFLIHTMFGYSRTRQGWNNPAQFGFASKVGLKTDTDATPRVQFAAADALTPWGVQDGKVDSGFQFNTTYHVNQSMSWLRGKHSFKFGWDVRRLQTTAEDKAGTNGLFVFARNQTALPTNTAGTGHSFASFLLGLPDTGQTSALPIPDVQIRYGYHAGYFQDDWKILPRLTLNLGMRYEVPIGFHFSNYQFSHIDLKAPNPGADSRPGALVFAGPGQGRTGNKRFYPTDFSNFGPRAGFAYQLSAKTVLRGGYGIFYQTLGNGGCGCTLGFAGPPVLIPSDGLNGAFAFDGGLPVPANVAKPPFIDPTFGNFRGTVDYLGENFGRAPRVHNWSLNVQHEVKQFLIDVAYVGNRGSGLNSTLLINQVDPKYLSLGSLLREPITSPRVAAAGFSKPFAAFPNNRTLAQALRPFPQFDEIRSRNTGDGKTWYDSLQTKVERRFGAWQMMTSYTWSKSLAKLHYRQIFSQAEAFAQDNYNLQPEKMLSWFDIPHTLNLLNSFDIPLGKGRRWLNSNRAVDLVLGGWTVAAAQRYWTSGLSPADAPNNLNTALFNGRKSAIRTSAPIRTGSGRDVLDPGIASVRYFNAGAFVFPGEFELGSSSRFYTEFRQPPLFQENLSIQKSFRLFDRGDDYVRLTYRADMFNLFNRTNFGVNMTVGNPGFGQATGPQQGPRIITMGLRLEF